MKMCNQHEDHMVIMNGDACGFCETMEKLKTAQHNNGVYIIQTQDRYARIKQLEKGAQESESSTLHRSLDLFVKQYDVLLEGNPGNALGILQTVAEQCYISGQEESVKDFLSRAKKAKEFENDVCSLADAANFFMQLDVDPSDAHELKKKLEAADKFEGFDMDEFNEGLKQAKADAINLKDSIKDLYEQFPS